MGGYATVGALVLAGWAFLRSDMAWVYLAATLAVEAWIFGRIASVGRHPAAVGEPPYDFTEEEARLVGRFRLFFIENAQARQLGSALASIGLTALVLVPWLAYKEAFAPAALTFANVLAAFWLTRRLIPMADTSTAWDKIRGGNQAAQ